MKTIALITLAAGLAVTGNNTYQTPIDYDALEAKSARILALSRQIERECAEGKHRIKYCVGAAKLLTRKHEEVWDAVRQGKGIDVTVINEDMIELTISPM